jgi:hypothetical protein
MDPFKHESDADSCSKLKSAYLLGMRPRVARKVYFIDRRFKRSESPLSGRLNGRPLAYKRVGLTEEGSTSSVVRRS